MAGRYRFYEYASFNQFDLSQFEERIKIIMEGRIFSTDSKKCKKNMPVKVIIHPSNIWYDKSQLRDVLSAIGDIEIIMAKSDIEDEDTLYCRISVPTKSCENMKDYLSYKGKASVNLVGPELFWRKGEIYYLGFRKQSN